MDSTSSSGREGEDLGTSEWHEVTQQAIDAFADLSGDHQWIHVDPERARHTPFGGTIEHGYDTLSLVGAVQRADLRGAPQVPTELYYAPAADNVPPVTASGYMLVAYEPPERSWPGQVRYELDRERSELRPHPQHKGMEEGTAVYVLAAE